VKVTEQLPNEPRFSCGRAAPLFRILRAADRHRRSLASRARDRGARQLQAVVRRHSARPSPSAPSL